MKSDTVRKGTQQAPHRSLFNALGMTKEEIEKRSRIQKRGKHSQDNKKLAYA